MIRRTRRRRNNRMILMMRRIWVKVEKLLRITVNEDGV